MHPAAIRLVQRKLAGASFNPGPDDGTLNSATKSAAAAALAARTADLPVDWQSWSDKRKVVASLQLYCRDAGIDPGLIDGWYGPQTEFAADALLTLETTGSLPPNWRDERPAPATRNRWPREEYNALNGFFGQHGKSFDIPSPPPNMVMVDCPWTLKISWNRNQTTRRIGCNAKVAESLARVLNRVWDTYGEAEIKRLHLDIYGGCYNPRRKRGGSDWSTHAWAIALDWDPDNNKLEWGRDRAHLARPEYGDWWKAWEEEGWCSLGRQRNFDWMHVQATSA